MISCRRSIENAQPSVLGQRAAQRRRRPGERDQVCRGLGERIERSARFQFRFRAQRQAACVSIHRFEMIIRRHNSQGSGIPYAQSTIWPSTPEVDEDG